MENILLDYAIILTTLGIIGIAIGLLIMFVQSYKETAYNGVQENPESLKVALNESDIAESKTVETPIQRTVHENTIAETQIGVENEGIYSDGIVYGGLIIGFIIIVGAIYIYVHKKINGLETNIDKWLNKIKGVK